MGKTLSSLEGNVKTIVAIGFVLGIGLILLGKFGEGSFLRTVMSTSNCGTMAGGGVENCTYTTIFNTTNATVNTTITSLATFSSWVGIIILVAVFGYLMHSFKTK